MRIALVTETFPPEVNGVAMTLNRLASGCAMQGHQLQIVRPLQQGEKMAALHAFYEGEQLVVPGIPLPGYDNLRMGRPAVIRLYRDWRCSRPDMVHIATEGPLGLASLVAANLLSIPTSSTYHTNFHQYSQHYKIGFFKDLFWVYLRVFHNMLGCTLPPTKEMAKELEAAGYQRVNVLSRGVDTDLFKPERRDGSLRAEWGAGDGTPVFLYVGRVAAEKNIRLAVDSFERVRVELPDAVLVIVGDGPELSALKREFPHFHYAGMRKGEDLARHYASGDYFLFPSVTETFGNVVTEAMSSGVPVLTYDYAAGRQYIRSGENGWLATFGDGEDFARQALAASETSKEARAAIACEARKTALSISWDRIVAILLQSWTRVIKESRFARR